MTRPWPRWASARSRATRALRSLRRWAWPQRSWTCASGAHPACPHPLGHIRNGYFSVTMRRLLSELRAPPCLLQEAACAVLALPAPSGAMPKQMRHEALLLYAASTACLSCRHVRACFVNPYTPPRHYCMRAGAARPASAAAAGRSWAATRCRCMPPPTPRWPWRAACQRWVAPRAAATAGAARAAAAR